MATSIGMMDGAYFVGRNEILGWINARLHLTLSRVEEVNAPSITKSKLPPFSEFQIFLLFVSLFEIEYVCFCAILIFYFFL